MSNKTIAKMAYVFVKAQALNDDGEVIGPTVRKLMEAATEFDEVWTKHGYDDYSSGSSHRPRHKRCKAGCTRNKS